MNAKSLIPKVLWIAIISLAIFSILHFIIGLTKPMQFVALAINLLLIFGLLRLTRWAYFLSIFASLLGPFVLSFEGTTIFYITLFLNLTVLIPVLICTKSFFRKGAKQNVPES